MLGQFSFLFLTKHNFYLKPFAFTIPLYGLLFSDFLYGLFPQLSNVPQSNITLERAFQLTYVLNNLSKMAPFSTPFIILCSSHNFIFKGMSFVTAKRMALLTPLKTIFIELQEVKLMDNGWLAAPPSVSVSAFQPQFTLFPCRTLRAIRPNHFCSSEMPLIGSLCSKNSHSVGQVFVRSAS